MYGNLEAASPHSNAQTPGNGQAPLVPDQRVRLGAVSTWLSDTGAAPYLLSQKPPLQPAPPRLPKPGHTQCTVYRSTQVRHLTAFLVREELWSAALKA